MSGALTKEAFKENLNSTFRIHFDSANIVPIELVEVIEAEPNPRQERFCLRFRGPLETPFAQGMRDIEHDTMGKLVLFLVPMARDSDGMEYEAVFNRLIKTEENK
jgi:hypothetical protein